MDSINFIKNSILIFFQKEKAYSEIIKLNIKVPLLWTFAILFLIQIIFSIILLTTGELNFLEILTFMVISTIFSIITILVTIGIIGIYQVSYLIFKGKGKFKEMINLFIALSIGLSILYFPLGFIFTALITIIKNQYLLMFFSVLYLILITILWIWYLIIGIRNCAKLHKISIQKSFFAFIIPIIIFVVSGMILITLILMLPLAMQLNV